MPRHKHPCPTRELPTKIKLTFASHGVELLVPQHQVLKVVLQSYSGSLDGSVGRQRAQQFFQHLVHVFLLDAYPACLEASHELDLGRRQEDGRRAGGAGPGCSADAVHVVPARRGSRVLDDRVDLRQVQTSRRDILERLRFFVISYDYCSGCFF